MESVEIPESVTVINIYAFNGNNLKNVVIPDSVINIGPNAFTSGKTPLETVELPFGFNILTQAQHSFSSDAVITYRTSLQKQLKIPFTNIKSLSSLTNLDFLHSFYSLNNKLTICTVKDCKNNAI